MTPTPFPATQKVAVAGHKAAVAARSSKPAAGLTKSSSTDSLDLVSQTVLKNALQCKPLQHVRAQLKKSAQLLPDNSRQVSRLELLLAPRRPEPCYTPAQDSTLSQEVNKAIKLSAQWTDIQDAVAQCPELSASNAAYALYRLGCLYTFASSKRRQEITASGLASTLLDAAHSKIAMMDAGSVTLLLDGCARLRQQPDPVMLDDFANLVSRLALSFEATQLPLILWAWSTLQFKPRHSHLAALDNAVDRLAPSMAPQGVVLTLHGFQAAKYTPSQRALNRLAETLHRKLSFFKPSEIADCLQAFSAFGYRPKAQLIESVAQLNGQNVHSNNVAGKRSLTAQTVRKPGQIDGLIEKHGRFVEQGSRAAASGIAAAGRVLQQVSLKVEELDEALNPAQDFRRNPKTYRHI